MPKNKRIINKKLIKETSYLPCVVCGCEERSPPHHVKSVGSGGDDTKENLMPLCGAHHTEIHKGTNKFMKKHPIVLNWIESTNG